MKSTLPQKPIVFFRVAWLQSYMGGEDDEAAITKDQSIVNLFEKHDGSDSYNFLPTCSASEPDIERYYIDYYGLHSRKINAIKFKIDPERLRINPICIVLFARKPKTDQFYIVGWYKNGTLLTNWQDTTDKDGNDLKYHGHAPIERASRLLPADKRNFKIDIEEGNNIIPSYGLKKDIISDVWSYIDQFPC